MKNTDAWSTLETAIVVIAFILVSAAFLYVVASPPIEETPVSTIGYAKIDAMPDIVGIYYSIETKGDTATDAGTRNAEIVDELTTSLMKLGFERSEIQTQSYSVNPNYEWTQSTDYRYPPVQVQKGFIASHQIKLEFSMEKTHLSVPAIQALIGDAIDAGINAGTNINYINFELSIERQNAYKIEAIKMATEDARLQAEAMATGSGKTLGRLMSISSSNFGYAPWKMYDAITPENIAAAKPVATSIQPSDQEITAQVSVVYAVS